MDKRNVVDSETFTDTLINLMMKARGPLFSGDELWKILGYASAVAMRVALSRGTLPVTIESAYGECEYRELEEYMLNESPKAIQDTSRIGSIN